MEQRSATGRLSLMMLLQYATWGAWMPIVGTYVGSSVAQGGLGFTEGQKGLILGLGTAVGAILAPFVAGQFADRYFSTERFLSFLLLIGAGVQWVLAGKSDYASWLWLSILYSVVFMPTLALSNSLAFANMRDRNREFPLVRVWGTIGFIAALWAFPMIYLQTNLHFRALPPFLVGDELPNSVARNVEAFRFSAMLSAAYAVFCWLLPHTPPKKDAVEPLAFRGAFRLFGRRSFTTLVFAALIVCTIHTIYHMQGGPYFLSVGMQNSSVGPALSVGQFSEIVMMLALGALLSKLGFRGVLALGAAAYIVRYGLWSQTQLPLWVLVSSQALHGLCYACFYASAYIYVDRIAPVDVRHSAQTVFAIITLGGGPVCAGFLNDYLARTVGHGSTHDFHNLWLALAGIAFVPVLLIAALFRDETKGDAKPAGP